MKAEIKSPFRTFPEEPKKKLRIPRIPFRLVIALIGASALIYFIQNLRAPSINPEALSENLNLAKHKYEEGKALLELNRVRARKVLEESKTQLTNLLDTLDKGSQDYKKAASLLKDVQKALKAAQAAFSVKPEVFYEMDLIRDGMAADKMGSSNENLYILSRNKKLIVKINTNTKKYNIIAGNDWIVPAKYIASNSKTYIFLPEGIGKAGKEKKIVVKSDEKWGEIADMDYFGGNLYLLDKKNGIHKYIPAGEDFVRRDYLKQEVDLSEAFSMAVDGNIWVSVGGRIYKFVNGRRDYFAVRGLKKPLGEKSYIVKTKNMDNLYIWDKEKKRVVVIDEEGEYRSQYKWKDIPEVKDYAIDQSEDKLFLLTNDKIYSVKLN